MDLSPVDRVVVVAVDGLRADSINTFGLHHIACLRDYGASATDAATVSPRGSWAAIASLLTGVSPDAHGVLSAQQPLQPSVPLEPVPEILARIGLPSSAFLAETTPDYGAFAANIVDRLRLTTVTFAGETAHEIVAAARHSLTTQHRGLIILHLPDLDLARRKVGTTSPAYREVGKRIDTAVGLVAALADVPRDPRTLLILVSGHGDDAGEPQGDPSSRRLDATMPLIIAGSPMPGRLAPHASLLDVAATLLYALGVPIPASYAGRPLREAFVRARTLPTPRQRSDGQNGPTRPFW
jgi:Type I phosphodiesterase / nucleotide pyrophosphatase